MRDPRYLEPPAIIQDRFLLLRTMTLSNLPALFSLAAALELPTVSELRWQLAGFAVGIVILSFGLAGLALFFFERKTADRSLVYFSLFAFLYALRLIFRQSFLHSLVAAPEVFWKYPEVLINNFIDNFIIVPLTLFVIEMVEARWKGFLRWVLAFQIAFATLRFFSELFRVGRHPVEITYHIVIVAYSALLIAYPCSFPRGQRMPGEVKIVYAGLAVFGLFVARNNLADLGKFRGRDIEAFGFLILIGCLAYVAASRSHLNEQRLLSLEKELEIARQIQSSILPREVPRIAGLDIAAQYVPMTAVAGDFYDFLVVDDRRVGMLEAKNGAEEEFGGMRFLEFLEAQSHLAAARLLSASLTELTRWSGKGEAGAREDDITLIAVDFAREATGEG